MKIEDDELKDLFKLVKNTVIDAVEKLNKYRENGGYFSEYYKYPDPFFESLKETDKYAEIITELPQIEYGVEKYNFSTYNNPINYETVFELRDDKFHINISELSNFNHLCDYLKRNEKIAEIMYETTENIEYKTCKFIAEIVNRFMYTKQADKDNFEIMEKLIAEKLERYFNENLKINICVPLNFILFSKDVIKLTDNVYIERIPKKMQISRFYFSHYDSEYENDILQNCAYMIVIKNLYIKNENNKVLESLKKNYWNYPIKKIDDIVAAIRIATGFDVGYSQVLMQPINWIDDTCTDMIPIYGTTIRAFSRRFVQQNFFLYEYKKITEVQTKKIINIYNTIEDIRNKCKVLKKEKKSMKKIFIGIGRLNRCMLREEDDDTALDAIIGIEALLSGDTHGEITYTISNRISIVSTRVDECIYSPNEMRKAMKKIYSFRSDIVHGRNSKETVKNIDIGGKKVYAKDLAIEFLRYSLLFILFNQQYIEDSNKIDYILDEILSKSE